jgi:hypothetical protein
MDSWSSEVTSKDISSSGTVLGACPAQQLAIDWDVLDWYPRIWEAAKDKIKTISGAYIFIAKGDFLEVTTMGKKKQLNKNRHEKEAYSVIFAEPIFCTKYLQNL